VRRDGSLYRGLQLVGAEAEGSGPAFIGHTARGINQVEAIWPCRVRALGRVAKFVENRGNFNSQLAHARSGHERAFFFTARTGEEDLFLHIALRLPDVGGMRFGDVDHEECDATSIFLIELVEGRNLPPEGRSGVASKYEYDWLLLGCEGRKLYLCGLI